MKGLLITVPFLSSFLSGMSKDDALTVAMMGNLPYLLNIGMFPLLDPSTDRISLTIEISLQSSSTSFFNIEPVSFATSFPFSVADNHHGEPANT